jgi:hypothetical protein
MIAFAPFRCLQVDQSEDASAVQIPPRSLQAAVAHSCCHSRALASESRPAPSGRAARGLRIASEPTLRLGGPAPINSTRWYCILFPIWAPMWLQKS